MDGFQRRDGNGMEREEGSLKKNGGLKKSGDK